MAKLKETTKTKVVKSKDPCEPSPVETQEAKVKSQESSAPSESTDAKSVPPTNVVNSYEEVLDSLTSEFKTVLSHLAILQATIKQVTTDVRKLDKRTTKELREASKKSKKKVVKDPNKPKRPPSGFAKPSLISEELCKFLGKDKGTEMARTEVTKYITTYIKDNGLQNPENKRQIMPDNSLQKLLNSSDSDTVTYFNLQKYMKHHFPPKKGTVVN